MVRILIGMRHGTPKIDEKEGQALADSLGIEKYYHNVSMLSIARYNIEDMFKEMIELMIKKQDIMDIPEKLPEPKPIEVKPDPEFFLRVKRHNLAQKVYKAISENQVYAMSKSFNLWKEYDPKPSSPPEPIPTV